jgi:hypothetical protein
MNPLEDSEDVELLKFSYFEMGSLGWLRHGVEMTLFTFIFGKSGPNYH